MYLALSTTITTIYHSPWLSSKNEKKDVKAGTPEEDRRAQKVLANLLLILIFAPKKNMK
jgi:hypothetical protein